MKNIKRHTTNENVTYKPQQSPIDLGEASNFAVVFPSNYLDIRWNGPLEGKPQGEHGVLFHPKWHFG